MLEEEQIADNSLRLESAIHSRCLFTLHGGQLVLKQLPEGPRCPPVTVVFGKRHYRSVLDILGRGLIIHTADDDFQYWDLLSLRKLRGSD